MATNLPDFSIRHLSILGTLLAARGERLPPGVLQHRSRTATPELDGLLSDLRRWGLVTQEWDSAPAPGGLDRQVWVLTTGGASLAKTHLARLVAQQVAAGRQGDSQRGSSGESSR